MGSGFEPGALTPEPSLLTTTQPFPGASSPSPPPPLSHLPAHPTRGYAPPTPYRAPRPPHQPPRHSLEVVQGVNIAGRLAMAPAHPAPRAAKHVGGPGPSLASRSHAREPAEAAQAEERAAGVLKRRPTTFLPGPQSRPDIQPEPAVLQPRFTAAATRNTGKCSSPARPPPTGL